MGTAMSGIVSMGIRMPRVCKDLVSFLFLDTTPKIHHGSIVYLTI
jgi:hypothetical protein